MFGKKKAKCKEPHAFGTWLKSNWRWLVPTVIFLPAIIYVAREGGKLWIAAMQYQTIGKSSPEYGLGNSQPTPPPQRSVLNRKNPIAWSKNAPVKIREAIKIERLGSNNAYFAGVLPPDHGWSDVTIAARNFYGPGNWYAGVVDWSCGEGFSTETEILGARQQGAAGKVFGLSKLSQNGSQELRLTNSSNNLKVAECYVQVAGAAPAEFTIDTWKSPPGVVQYEVEVGVDEVSFTLPHNDWKYAWVVPVHHKDYAAIWQGREIPPNGVSVPSCPEMFSIQLTANRERATLSRAKLFQPENVQSSTMSLSLKLPGDNPTPEQLEQTRKGLEKPATMIVGLCLR